jgi:hypothetical protein
VGARGLSIDIRELHGCGLSKRLVCHVNAGSSGKLADRGFALSGRKPTANPRGDHPLIVNRTNGLAGLRNGNFVTICRNINKP